MRRVDAARYLNSTWGPITALVYTTDPEPMPGEVWDVSGYEVYCDSAVVVKTQECAESYEEGPVRRYWFLTMRPNVENPCTEEFLRELE